MSEGIFEARVEKLFKLKAKKKKVEEKRVKDKFDYIDIKGFCQRTL